MKGRQKVSSLQNCFFSKTHFAFRIVIVYIHAPYFRKNGITERCHVVFLGKDLSSRSKTDLDCIFGKRQSKKTPEVLSHIQLIYVLFQHHLIFCDV